MAKEVKFRKPKVELTNKVKITNDDMALAIKEYIRVFNEGTPRSLGHYIDPREMYPDQFKLHFNALKAAFDVVMK